jgi:hypothetical protein
LCLYLAARLSIAVGVVILAAFLAFFNYLAPLGRVTGRVVG